MNSELPVKGYIFDIKRYAIHDGPGIRITVFLQGCPLQCWWCHNPEGIRAIPGPEAEGNAFRPHRTMTVQELIREIEKEIVFFDESGGGVTFSGGEPLVQYEFLGQVLKECKKREIHTALDTSGYALPEVLTSVMDDVDLFLFDLKLLDDKEHEDYTGVSNQDILNNLKLLVDSGKNVTVRFPLIPGITNTQENMEQIARHVLSLKRIQKIHILPYHKTGQTKYRRLQIDDKMQEIQPPSTGVVEAAKHWFEDAGLNVHVGG